MALPSAIQQQVEAAEALQQQIYAPESAEVTNETATDPQLEADPAPQVVEAPKQAEPVAPVEAPKQTQAEDAAYWKSRFETVRGKLDAEMPRLYETIREQSSQLKTLTEKLNAAPEPKPEPLTTTKDVEDFGQDLVDMVGRVSADIASRAVASALAEFRTKELGAVKEQVGAVQERVVMSDADRFWSMVKAAVPDWDAVDENLSWIEFLNTRIPGTMKIRRQEAAEAIGAFDPEPIVELVQLWKAQNPDLFPKPSAPAAPPQESVELQRQVAPSTTRSSAPSQATGKIWSRADYETAYDVRNLNRFGAQKAAEMAAEADRAVAEGRVRW